MRKPTREMQVVELKKAAERNRVRRLVDSRRKRKNRFVERGLDL